MKQYWIKMFLKILYFSIIKKTKLYFSIKMFKKILNFSLCILIFFVASFQTRGWTIGSWCPIRFPAFSSVFYTWWSSSWAHGWWGTGNRTHWRTSCWSTTLPWCFCPPTASWRWELMRFNLQILNIKTWGV